MCASLTSRAAFRRAALRYDVTESCNGKASGSVAIYAAFGESRFAWCADALAPCEAIGTSLTIIVV
jgi:hypothetical protein